MKSLAIKNDYNVAMPSTVGEQKEYFPELTVSDKVIPELADMNVGDECTICVKVRVRGIRADNSGTRFDLECLSAEYDEKEESND